MVEEHTLGLMEESMQGNGRMGNIMVKEHSLGLMEESMNPQEPFADSEIKINTPQYA